ncbi:MAG: efflux RND transporter periplasmic adaptor subunit [Verrucomicrobiia bacterium]
MKKTLVFTTIGIVVAFVGGLLVGRSGSSTNEHDHSHSTTAASPADDIKFWTCSMHPEIQLPDPGKCPKCQMALIPVKSGAGANDGPRDLTLSSSAQKLASIQTSLVERRFVDAAIRLVGKVDYDETRLGHITSRVPGRLDRLFVDYTGVSITKGDHLVRLYSPELLEAQQTLIQAVKTAASLQNSATGLAKQRALTTVDSSREKLRLWGLDTNQIARIEASEKPEEHLTINAPMSGIVVHKNAVEGMYVQTGARIYTIADLSRVWVMLDAYESDLAWLHYGQDVEFETEAYSGETFHGRIAFIDPVLNPKTRTVRIRVNVDNQRGRLKPEMFVRAIVRSRVATGGKVMDPGLAGKWISPMHPEIVKDGPGDCDICGMALVKAEDLGYVRADAGKDEAPLVIPASAPLQTGKRAVVYVERDPGKYEGVEIELGPRAGEWYLVKSGLKEGDRIVTRGAFKIDSAIQIRAGNSMMNPEEGQGAKSKRLDAPADFHAQLTGVYEAYLQLQKALSGDDFEASKSTAKNLEAALGKVDMTLLKGEAHMAWMAQSKALKNGGDSIAAAGSIDESRKAFEGVSIAMITALKQFGASPSAPANIFHCPMALNGKGADWLQATEGTENPYYGSKMFQCGDLTLSIETRATVGAEPGKDDHAGHNHNADPQSEGKKSK